MHIIYFILLLFFNLQASDFADNKNVVKKSIYANKRVFIVDENDTIFDKDNKGVKSKQYYDNVLAIYYDNNKINVLFYDFDRIYDKNKKVIYAFGSGSAKNINVVSNNAFLFTNGVNLVKFDKNLSNKQMTILDSSVEPKVAYILDGIIYISFYDRTLIKFNSNLKPLESYKTNSLITAMGEFNKSIIFGFKNGNILYKNKEINISNSQIDSLVSCNNKIYIGDWEGKIYTCNKEFRGEILQKDVFKDRVIALFCDKDLGLIAVSWDGDIVILNEF